MADHDLTGFTQSTFTHDGAGRRVLRRGTGPAVIIMAEIPGITPKVIEFAERVAAARLHGRTPRALRHARP
ncbi:hypothetical protein [Streptomyces sp. NPDC002587]